MAFVGWMTGKPGKTQNPEGLVDLEVRGLGFAIELQLVENRNARLRATAVGDANLSEASDKSIQKFDLSL